MVDIDFSFIRLRQTKEEAFNLGESPASTLRYEEQVQLKPFDLQPYLQMSNVSGGIALEDYTLFIVDCYGNEYDATSSFNVLPFIDSDNIQQVAFELIFIEKDFGSELVYFRIDQAGAESWYSNKMLITNQGIEYTSRIEYKHNERYFGTDYSVSDLYQSIRLNFYYNNFVSQTESQQYYAISNSQTFSLRPNIKHYNEYIVERFNGWYYKRLDLAVNSDLFYIDTVRNEIVQPIEVEERDEDANVSESKFLTDPIETDIYNPVFQIFTAFNAIAFNPVSNITLNTSQGTALSQVVITFNQNISLLNVNGFISRPTNTTQLINNTNVSVSGMDLIIDTTGIFNENGTYTISIDNNSIKGETYGEIWEGKNDYFIKISSGAYSNLAYNPAAYQTN